MKAFLGVQLIEKGFWVGDKYHINTHKMQLVWLIYIYLVRCAAAAAAASAEAHTYIWSGVNAVDLNANHSTTIKSMQQQQRIVQAFKI